MRGSWILTLAFTGCVYFSTEKVVTNKTSDGPVKTYSKDGTLLNEISYKNGIRHGVSKSFYKNGNVQLEIPYDSGKRHGVIKRYYEDGKLYQESEFIMDEETGIQKKYRENGKLQSIAKYESGEPCMGLQEYLLDGSVRKNYPEIRTRSVDRVKASGEYIVYVTMSNNTGKVEFYEGELTSAGCLSNRLVPIPFDKKAKQGILRYSIPVGTFMMEEVTIVADVTTLNGNHYITQKKINIAIDN